jgi:hypothetical protein
MSSPLLHRLLADIKEAMKSGQKEALVALRSLHAAIKDATTNAGREATDADVATVVAKAIKQRQDAIHQFRAAGRNDLADNDQRDIDLYRKYQPAQLSEAEIEALVRKAIAGTGAASRKEMGKVMAALMPDIKGRADGKVVNQIVQNLLPA